jgi:hypothetical protein
LLDATYGTSTYEAIDVGNVYYVYRTTTGIITRNEPRPVPPPEGEPLSVTIDRACGEPSLAHRVVAGTDDGAVAVLDWIGSLTGP